MSLIADLKSLEPSQRSAIWASYLGWTLDAFDFFLMVFMLKAIAAEFGTDIEAVAVAIFLTLAARPIGAFVFGWLGEHFGRRPVLMADIILFSVFEFASGFAPSLTSLLVLRFLFGIAMGGEWGLGASLVMETIPAKLRGPVSGLLQSGYPSGYFVASLVYFLLFDTIGWRGMFMVGVAPALLVLLIRIHVKESPVFEGRRGKVAGQPDRRAVPPLEDRALHDRADGRLQRVQPRHAGPLSDLPAAAASLRHPPHRNADRDHERRRDRRRDRLRHLVGDGSAESARSSSPACSRLPVIPLWAFTATPLLLAIGGFLMQVAVQGAWGIVPVHLNELSPPLRARLFPGFAYQLGNLIMSQNARLPGAHRREPRQQLRAGAGHLRRRDGAPHRVLDRDRPGAEERRLPRRRQATGTKPSAVEMRLSGRTDVVSSYRGTAERPDQAKAIIAVVAVHLALAFVILTGLNVRSVSEAVERLKTFNLSDRRRLLRRRHPSRAAAKR